MRFFLPAYVSTEIHTQFPEHRKLLQISAVTPEALKTYCLNQQFGGRIPGSFLRERERLQLQMKAASSLTASMFTQWPGERYHFQSNVANAIIDFT